MQVAVDDVNFCDSTYGMGCTTISGTLYGIFGFFKYRNLMISATLKGY